MCVSRHLFDVDLEFVYVYGARGQWAHELLFFVSQNPPRPPPKEKKNKKDENVSMPRIGFLPTTPVLQRQTSDRSAIIWRHTVYYIAAAADKEDSC